MSITNYTVELLSALLEANLPGYKEVYLQKESLHFIGVIRFLASGIKFRIDTEIGTVTLQVLEDSWYASREEYHLVTHLQPQELVAKIKEIAVRRSIN